MKGMIGRMPPQYALSVELLQGIEDLLGDPSKVVPRQQPIVEITHYGETILRLLTVQIDIIGADTPQVLREMMHKANEYDAMADELARLRRQVNSLQDQ